MARLRLELLGGFAATLDGGRPCALPTRKSQALMAYLALSAGRLHSREKLATLLWGDSPEPQARQSFRQALAGIRRALGPAAESILTIQGDAIGLNRDAVAVDVAELEDAAAGEDGPSLEAGVELCKGEFLDGLRVDAQGFEEWRMVERERLHALGLQLLARLLEQQIAADQLQAAAQTALRSLARDPLQEPVHRILMRLQLRLGRRAAALKQYQTCIDWLARELGAEPEEETRQLYRDILRTAGPAGRARTPALPAAADQLEDVPMLGREREAARLQQALTEVLDGAGQTILLTGEAGIGKTRLMRDFAPLAAAAGASLLLGRCHETEQILPLRPWVDVLRGDRTGLDPVLAERLGAATSRQLARIFPELHPGDDASITATEQPALLFDALAALIADLATAQPLVLILEDLHWIDGLSARFVAFLGRRIARLPVLVVGSMRPEEILDAPVLAQSLRELRGDGLLGEITLEPLNEADTLRLADTLQPAGRDRAARGRIAAEIWTASGGNPFVIVESIRALQADGATGSITHPQLAGGIRDLVTGRLDRLGDLPRQVVQTAAAIGREFGFPLLVSAAGLPEAEAASAVEELVRRQFLATDGDRLDFRHDWIRLVAYESLLPPRRAMLHAAIGAALEALHHDHPDEIADQLGHHYARAGNAAKAIEWLDRVHQLASRRYALGDALKALQQAIVVAAGLPAPERDRQTLDLVLRQAFVMSIQGRQREIMALLQAEAARLERVSEPKVISEYYSRLGLTCFFLGNRTLGQEAAERGLAEGEKSGDAECVGKALHVLSLNAFEGGRPRQGIAYAQRAVPLFNEPHNRQWLGLIYHDLALNCVTAGELDAALEAAEQADRLARNGEWLRVRVLAGYVTAWALALRGDAAGAIAVARHRLELSRDPMASGLVSGALGLALMEQGEPEAAITMLVEVVAQLQKNPVRSGEARHLAFLSEAYLGAGNLAEAQEAAARVITLGEAEPMPFNVGLAQRTLGRIALARGDLVEAGRLLAQALATFRSCEAAFEIARVQVDLAAVAARHGEAPAAQRLLAEACRVFQATGARPRAEAARRLAGGLGLAEAGA